ncbi:hypothetical protein [Rossellomorea marisflavi]|uniref:hypothetical protein n=1 Tax=Rossellomorea marisflavi TaxID=189381 RepID=UPI001EE1FE69|nr:hypothetical protein [Rossellomorea marisflavi]UKS64994.1 hypothetical protein K6T23_20050 [Rossellomorea marisflavi]
MSNTASSLPPQSDLQRRSDDSFGNRGKVETLQAPAEAAQAPSPRKAGGRSEKARTYQIVHEVEEGVSHPSKGMSNTAHSKQLLSALQRRAADSFGNRGKVETLQAKPKRLN